jgi:ubiquinone/menaquinone biosynthesis C-methylase UbiE
VSNTDNGAPGRYFASGSAQQRPEAKRELTAYGGARIFRGKRVLDLGTGDGRLAFGAAIWAREVVGIDPDPTAIRDARANARRMRTRNVRFVVGPAQELPFEDGSFDVVILSWVL